MEELLGLIILALILTYIVFTLIFLRLMTARRPSAARPPARRMPRPGDAAPAEPSPADQLSDLGEVLRETGEILRKAFPVTQPTARSVKSRPVRRRELPPPLDEAPAPLVMQEPERPAGEQRVISPAAVAPDFDRLRDPRVAARAMVLVEIFGAPRYRRPHRPPGGR